MTNFGRLLLKTFSFMFCDSFIQSPENTIIFDKKFETFTGKKIVNMGMDELVLEIVTERITEKVKAEAIAEGLSQGIEKGADLKTRDFIKNARVKKRMSFKIISELVDLSPKRVQEILHEMGIE